MNDQEQKELDKRKAIERANSYRDMLNLWAWKDLMGQIRDEKDARIEKLLVVGGDVEFVRGFTAALRFIDTSIAYILSEGVN